MIQSEVMREHAKLETKLDNLTDRYTDAILTYQLELARKLAAEMSAINMRLWQLETPEALWSSSALYAL